VKHIELNGISLAVAPVFAKEVVDEHTVLLFLHEALGSIGQWKSFPQQLCNALKFNGIVYERQGYGNSSPLTSERTNAYLHHYAWEELPRLLDVLLPQEKKVILVGHSDGASIALLYAAKYPQRVQALVSMAAHVIVEDVTLAGIAPAVQAYQQGKLDGLKKYHGDKTEQLFYAWAHTWNLREFRDWNICKDIETIDCPILAIQGINDQYGTEKQLDLIDQHTPLAIVQKVLIPQCGHHPHLEQPAKVIELICNFAK